MSLPFDELNALAAEKNQRGIPIERYFDEMSLTKQQKQDRKDFAKELQEILFVAMSMIYMLVIEGRSGTTLDTVKTNLTNDIDRLIRKFTYPDGYMMYIISEYVSEFVDVTVRRSASENPEDLAYWYSQDRARLNAEDEANAIFNYDEYRQAVFDGKTMKEWVSMRDAQVRRTHAEVDGERIPIDDAFLVGTSLMRFAKDTSLGASDSEICGCRCSIRYF